MDNAKLLESLITSLKALKIEVAEVAGTLNLVKGRGPMAVKTNIDPDGFLSELGERDLDEAGARRALAGYASGVNTVMLEPKRSKARDWTFEKTAGRIFPRVELWSFIDGVTAATDGDPPFYEPFQEDLVLAYIVRLDMGLRPLTQGQFDDWSATRDRITSAGRSMLFHETREVRWKEVEGHPSVFQLNRGDGLDAGRCTVFADAFFTEVDSGYRFTIPGPHNMYFVKSSDPDAIAALKEATIESWSGQDYPYTTTVFSFQGGRPVPAEH